MLFELQIANDFWPKQRNYVREHGKFKAGDDFFRDGGTAKNVAAFEDEDFFPSAREIGRIDKAVVAAADNNYVVMLGHEEFLRIPRGKDKCGKSRSILQARACSHKVEATRRLTLSQSDEPIVQFVITRKARGAVRLARYERREL